MRLSGKTAFITGAARGIGFEFAKAYVREGARVAIADINIERAQSAAAEIGDAAIAVEIDVSNQESIDRAVALAAAWRPGGPPSSLRSSVQSPKSVCAPQRFERGGTPPG